MNHDQADTRATAYLFGELLPEEAIAFEQELERSSELQREVDALRDAIGALRTEFHSTSKDVSPAHRQAIGRAIEQSVQPSESTRSDNPVPPPVVLASDASQSRQWLLPCAIAAAVLLALSLTFPYLLGPDENQVSQTKSGAYSTNLNPASLKSFNNAIEEQRFDDAETIANQFAKNHADDPLADTLLQTSRLARSMANTTAGELGLKLDPMLEFSSSNPDVALQLADDDKASTAPVVDEVALMMSDDLAVQTPPLSETIEIEDLAGGAVPLATSMATKVEQNQPVPSNSIPKATDGFRSSSAKTQTASRSDNLEFGFRSQISQGGYGGVGQSIASGKRTARRSRRSQGNASDMDIAGGMDMSMGMGEMDDMMGGMDMMGDTDAIGMMGMGDIGFGIAGDQFDPIQDNDFLNVTQSPLSTFSIDVDTASYAKVRSMLQRHALPSPDSVRIEELLNYFHYDYPVPSDDHPFSASMEIATCPWNPDHRLARVGIKGREIESDHRSSNLVFLLDVSGSMDEPNKLPLVVDGMKMLTEQLSENDKVAIVVYAGAAGLVLESTRGDKKQTIMSALDRLKAGGSTNGGQGIALAYDVARDNFVVGGTNRVILCSDGDFNVGVTGTDALVALAKENAKSNVFLSILGFGTGNHNDAMMERVSNDANGNYAFIDNASEARKVLIEELGGTLVTIAKDVKIQIEFNPRQVESYRLIGYENRALSAEDFNDDGVDAGEIGAGHTVTALYEVVPATTDEPDEPPKTDKLRYQDAAKLNQAANSGEMLAVKLRYKEPEGKTSTLIQFPISDTGRSFRETDRDFKFAASVAAFGMLLRHSPYSGTASMDRVLNMAREGAMGDDYGYRTEFLALVERAQQLTRQ